MKLLLSYEGKFTVLAVCDRRGDCELRDFLNSLGSNLQKDRDHMLELLESVATCGPPNNTAISKRLRGCIHEFRKGRLRVVWFADKGSVIVCTGGFVKRTKKTPILEIERAERIYQQYIEDRDSSHIEIVREE